MQNSFLVEIANEIHPGEVSLYDYAVSNFDSFLKVSKQRSIYFGCKFEDISKSKPHTRGMFGERMVQKLAEDCGLLVGRSRIADRRINGIDIEIKTVMQKEDGGFLVNQIRPQDYKYIILAVFIPKDAFIFTIPKEEMLTFCTGQHGGNGATETKIYGARDFEQLWHDLGKYSGLGKFIDYLNGSSYGINSSTKS